MTNSEMQPTSARIMIVDDNPEFLNGLELTLEMESYTVLSAPDGTRALEMLEDALSAGNDASQLPDLILTDIMMPGMDGYAFYERVRANPYTNHIPIIFLTAKDSSDDIQYGKSLGSEDYLTKLASTEEILASVRGKLARIQQRRELLGMVNNSAVKTEKSTDEPTPIRWNLIVMVAVFIVLFAIFGWGVATIMGIL